MGPRGILLVAWTLELFYPWVQSEAGHGTRRVTWQANRGAVRGIGAFAGGCRGLLWREGG